jgi:hypothetical protein
MRLVAAAMLLAPVLTPPAGGQAHYYNLDDGRDVAPGMA